MYQFRTENSFSAANSMNYLQHKSSKQNWLYKNWAAVHNYTGTSVIDGKNWFYVTAELPNSAGAGSRSLHLVKGMRDRKYSQIKHLSDSVTPLFSHGHLTGTFADVAADEQGLWLLLPEANNNRLLHVHLLDKNSLQTIRDWHVAIPRDHTEYVEGEYVVSTLFAECSIRLFCPTFFKIINLAKFPTILQIKIN